MRARDEEVTAKKRMKRQAKKRRSKERHEQLKKEQEQGSKLDHQNGATEHVDEKVLESKNATNGEPEKRQPGSNGSTRRYSQNGSDSQAHSDRPPSKKLKTDMDDLEIAG